MIAEPPLRLSAPLLLRHGTPRYRVADIKFLLCLLIGLAAIQNCAGDLRILISRGLAFFGLGAVFGPFGATCAFRVAATL